MTVMLQSFFPAIDISKVKTDNIQRCVLFYLNSKDDTIEFRHFAIKKEIIGINKRIRELCAQKNVPDLRDYEDISEYILRDLDFQRDKGNALDQSMDSESTQKTTESQTGKQRINIKLQEIGPRLKLKLIKIEEGVLKGPVVYHRFINLSEAEQLSQNKTMRERKKLKTERRKAMEAILEKKEEIRQEKIQKKADKRKHFKEAQKFQEREMKREYWRKKEAEELAKQEKAAAKKEESENDLD